MGWDNTYLFWLFTPTEQAAHLDRRSDDLSKQVALMRKAQSVGALDGKWRGRSFKRSKDKKVPALEFFAINMHCARTCVCVVCSEREYFCVCMDVCVTSRSIHHPSSVKR
jgi:hypothetical protein